MSHRPYVSNEVDSNPDSEENETILYAVKCEELEEILHGEKIPWDCKVATQDKEDKPTQQQLELHSNVIAVLSKVSPSEITEAQQVNPTIGQICKGWRQATNLNYLKLGQKNKKKIGKYICHLGFRKGVLHWIYEIQGSRYHQLIFPAVYTAKVSQLLHDEQDHQGQSVWLAHMKKGFSGAWCPKMSTIGWNLVKGVKRPSVT